MNPETWFPELDVRQAHALCDDLLHAARRRHADAAAIRTIHRVPLSGSWYRIEKLHVEIAGGPAMEVFLKDFGTYPEPKDEMEARRERERYLYEDVFAHHDLGTPAFIASVWDDRHTWLLLEYVDGVPLSWCGLEPWGDAAAWIARFQTALAGREPHLAGSPRLKHHGRAYFAGVADRARSAALAHGPEVVSAVDAVAPAYLRLAAVLMDHPQTLVHGAYRAGQLLVVPAEHGVRICPTDWEIAAIGSCLYDLATLLDGFDDDHLRRFWTRFSASAGWRDGASVRLADLRTAVVVCRMHRTLKWLAGSHRRRMSQATVDGLVAALVEDHEGVRT